MATAATKTYSQAMIDIKDAYPGEWPATAKDIATWAVNSNRWEMDAESQIRACARALADAMRSQKHEDKQGRTVRTMAAAKRSVIDEDTGEQTQAWFWGDVRDERNHEHVVIAFRERAKQVQGDVESLRQDIESYNENHLPDGRERLRLNLFSNEVDD